MNPLFRFFLVRLLVATGSLCAAHAAPISWSTPTDTSSKSQLIEGTVVLAFSGGNAAAITGGGLSGTQNYSFTGGDYTNLSFTPAPAAGTLGNASNGAPSTGDANFDIAIRSLAYTGSASITSGTQTITGLTDGTSYQVQVFFNDQRSGRVMTFGDGESPTPSKVDLSSVGSGWGQHAVGYFTASGTTQLLTHATNGFGNVHVNAILVTQSGPPPAPTTPTHVVATAGNHLIHLDWDDYPQPGLLEYRIKRSTTMGGPYTQIGTSEVSEYFDDTAVNGTNYYYVVTSVNIDNLESAPSTEEGGNPAPIVEPPNFLFIIADDMDTYALNAYRNSEPVEGDAASQPYPISTPNLDRLAAEGMLFHQVRIMGSWTGAVCTGSRTCIMTGRNTWSAQTDANGGGNAADTLPGIFNRGVRSGMTPLPHATYRTCKNGNSYPTANLEFSTVNDATKRGNTAGNGSEWHADRSIEHIDDWRSKHRPIGKPFLMYLGFSHPHDERNAQPSLATFYNCVNTTNPGSLRLNPNAPPLPINHLPINEATGTPANYPFHPFDHGHLNVRDENTAPGILQYRSEAVVRNEIGRNFACVDWIDQQLGRVFAKLEDPDGDGDPSDSVLDNTYIVFTADHGIAIGRHGLQGKQNLYEHTWKVPYLVRGPGIAAGSETDALVYLHDTFPTFCDLAGLDLPDTIDDDDGQSFRSVLEGTSDTARTSIYGLYSGGSKPGMRAITEGRFKLIKYDVGGNATQVTQMFDLETNPFELLPEHGVPNIADAPAYQAIRQELEEMLMEQRLLNDDADAFLGDRTLLRFEDGVAGQPASTLADRFPFGNHGTAASGTGQAPPVFSAATANRVDLVVGETNTLSLDFEQDLQHYAQVPDARELDFGAAPFTLEAWVKLETMPDGNNLASSMPVVMKKVIGASDSNLDYLFLASAGSFGDVTTFNRLALHLGSGPILSTLAIPDTEWHHISVALDPVNDVVRFTLDDQVDTQVVTITGTANAGPLTIGAHFNSSGVIDCAFDGLIDELSITDGFLSLSELQPRAAISPVEPFKISSIELSEGGTAIDLTFESVDTRLYTIQCSDSLLPNSWTDVLSFIPGAAGAPETSVNSIPLGDGERSKFFRVVTSDGM
ncbi:sulfatase-like hydrolase/transferase [Haloferula chungangensis]|uniref:Sulfatase-like hydrolase/transferase n=1 Tax=Haloferula chungangensis TaxID=1048331 RepID=A0ABW2L7X0_9BACT